MLIALNQGIAGRLDEVSRILAEQGANRFRVQAYQQAASAVRGLLRPAPLYGAFLQRCPGAWTQQDAGLGGPLLRRSVRGAPVHRHYL